MRTAVSFAIVIFLALIIDSIRTFKFAVLSDIHVTPFYDPYASPDYPYFCSASSLNDPNSTSVYAPFGRIGCDSPIDLLEAFLKRINMTEANTLDALFLTGDFIGHGLSLENDEAYNQTVDQLLQNILSQAMEMISQYLPNTLIIPTLGNNDYLYHYNSPHGEHSQDYYDFLFEIWFTNISKNVVLPEYSTINETFRYGGYYRIDINDEVAVLALNTLVYNQKFNPSKTGDLFAKQLEWLELQLNTSQPNKKFILTYHIYPGQQYYQGGAWSQFHDNFTSQFDDLYKKYREKIIIEIAGHDHLGDIRYFSGSNRSQTYNKFEFLGVERQLMYHNMIISPAIAPNFKQNPGYMTMQINYHTPIQLKMHFLPIEKTYNKTLTQQLEFREVDFQQFGLRDLTTLSIQKLHELLGSNLKMLLTYLTLKVGYDPHDDQEFSKAMKLLMDDQGLITKQYDATAYFCQMSQSFLASDLTSCIKKHSSYSNEFTQ